ncbi:MAG: hypothetical protein WKF58_19155 [Ilumatobacteraceae bacterium]
MSNHALYLVALERARERGLLQRQTVLRDEAARLEIGYRVGRMLVIREVMRQAPAGFSAATKCFCTEHEWAVSQFVARAARAGRHPVGRRHQGALLRTRLHDHGRHVERDAQHPR